MGAAVIDIHLIPTKQRAVVVRRLQMMGAQVDGHSHNAIALQWCVMMLTDDTELREAIESEDEGDE